MSKHEVIQSTMFFALTCRPRNFSNSPYRTLFTSYHTSIYESIIYLIYIEQTMLKDSENGESFARAV